MEEEFESHINWSAVFRIIKKRLVIIVAIALVLAIVCALLTAFVLNNGKDTYSLSFDLKSPTSGYPDGTSFNINSLVYAESLQEIKDDGGEQFSSLDITKLSSGGIKIIDNAVPAQEGETVTYTSRYTIQTTSGYFDSFEQATAFMRAVAEKYVLEVNTRLATRNYSTWESEFANATTYDAQLSALSNQYNSILSTYDGFTSTRAYADFVPATLNESANTLTISQLHTQAEGQIGDDLSALKTGQATNGYVLISDNSYYYLTSQVEALELERSENTDKIDALTAERDELVSQLVAAGGADSSSVNIAATFESFNSSIASLTQRNVEIAYDLNRLYKSLGYTPSGEGAATTWTPPSETTYNQAPESFTKEITSIYNQIKTNTSVMEAAVKALYAEFTKAEFAQAEAQVESGGTSVILVTIAVFVVAALAAGVIFSLAEYQKTKKMMEEAAAPAENNAKPAEDNAQPADAQPAQEAEEEKPGDGAEAGGSDDSAQ